MSHPINFAMGQPKWLSKIKDEDVRATIFAIIFSANIDQKNPTVDELRKKIKDLNPDWDKEKVEDTIRLLIEHTNDD
ncbi:hypothetical protein IJ076_03110 [Candidatus Saccharibacteria bacterium]|nr:hypothetical protein [Candidatus Saccharibacteria bacterium]